MRLKKLVVAGLLATLALLLGACGEPEDVDARIWQHINKAQAYRNDGEYKAAIIELKNAIRLDQRNAGARALLGEIYVQLRRGEDAEKELLRAFEFGHAQAPLTPLFVRALLLQQAYDRALVAAKPGPNLGPEQMSEYRVLRGEAYMGLQRLAEAEQEFDGALQLVPNNVDALIGKGRLAQRRQHPEEAARFMQQAVEQNAQSYRAWAASGDVALGMANWAKAEQDYSRALSLNEGLLMVRLKRALCRLELNSLDLAEEDLQPLLQQAPEDFMVQHALGVLRARQERYGEAEAAFQRALAKNPTSADTLARLGVIQLKMGGNQQAERHLASAWGGGIRTPQVAVLLSKVRVSLDDLQGAEDVLDAALLLYPDDVALIELMVQVAEKRNKLDKSNQYRARLAEQGPDKQVARLGYGLGLLREDRLAEALAELEKVAVASPDTFEARLAFVSALIRDNKFDAAQKEIAAIKDKWPDNGAPWTLEGIVHAKQGHLDLSRAAFEQALQRLPGDPSAAANLAMLALADGDQEKARDYYQQILKHYPDHVRTLLRLAALEAQQGDMEAYRKWVEQAHAKDQASSEARIRLAALVLQDGDHERALALLRELPAEKTGLPIALRLRAEARLAGDDVGGALDLGRQLLRKSPEVADTHYLLARIHRLRGDRDGLREHLRSALEKQVQQRWVQPLAAGLVSMAPDGATADAWLADLRGIRPELAELADLQGRLALTRGKFDQATQIFEQMQKRWPEDRRGALGLAEVARRTGQVERGEQALVDWLKAHPDDQIVRLALAEHYMLTERVDRAEPLFAQLLAENPDSPIVLNNLAWLLREVRPESALRHAQKAVSLNPSPPNRDTLAVVLMNNGRTRDAADLLEELYRQRPGFASAGVHYGLALLELGDRAKAERVLSEIKIEQGLDPALWQELQALRARLGTR